MCEFCSKHTRKRWFLEPENYAEKLLENKKRKNVLQKLAGFGLEYYMKGTAELMEWARKPLLHLPVKYLVTKFAGSEHSGQVVTTDDAIEIAKLSDNHVCFQCMCRKMSGTKEKACCLNFGPMRDLCKKANPKEKMEEIDKAETIYRIKDWQKEGLVPEVLYATAPFPIALCNCDRKYCIPMKYRFLSGIPATYMKGHEIAVVNPEKCKGCAEICMPRCQFGAMFRDIGDEKVIIDPTKCFGCSLCKQVCPKDAIYLKDRETTVKMKEKW